MSGFGKSNASILPEDIEVKLANIQKIIADLGDQKVAIEKDVEDKRIIQTALSEQISAANTELNRIVLESRAKIDELNDREGKITQKESALDVYANALQEKEKKINKYLSIFENMKDVISK